MSNSIGQEPAPPQRTDDGRVLGVGREHLAYVAAGVGDAATGPTRNPPPWLTLPQHGWKRVGAVVLLSGITLGAFFAVDGQLEALGLGGLPAVLVALVQAVPLLLLVASPLLAWRWLVLGLFAGTLLAPPGQGWPWPVTSLLVLIGLLYVVARTHPRRTVIGVGSLTILVGLAPGAVFKDVPVVLLVVLSGVVALVLVLGDTVRDRGVVRSRLATATAQRQKDLAHQAVLEERSHIARELHDVVAHHMSMIAVQAEAAPLRYPDLSPEVVRTFGVIRDASREALTEMRRVVGALRDEQGRADVAPQPGVDQLEHLVETSRRTGMEVDLAVTGRPRRLSPAVDISTYRVVQEALSNVRRHAPGAAARVALHYGDDLLTLRVTNDSGQAVRGDG